MIEQNHNDVRELAMSAVSGWLTQYIEIPGFRDWKNQSMVATLTNDIDDQQLVIKPFPHSDEVISEHRVISSYLNLVTALQDIAEMEYYFRRYPFSGLPVSRANHLRHTCEAFFSKIYIFEERLTQTLNEIQRVTLPQKLNVSGIKKAFQKSFRKDLRERNDIHHHVPYKDVELDQISMINLLQYAPTADFCGEELERLRYRQVSKDWVLRVRSRTNAASRFVDAVGSAMLQHCDFLEQGGNSASE